MRICRRVVGYIILYQRSIYYLVQNTSHSADANRGAPGCSPNFTCNDPFLGSFCQASKGTSRDTHRPHVFTKRKNAFSTETELLAFGRVFPVMLRVLVSVHRQKLPISAVDLKQGYGNNHNLHSQSREYMSEIPSCTGLQQPHKIQLGVAYIIYTSSTAQGGSGCFRIGNLYRRVWLLWITDGRAQLLMDLSINLSIYLSIRLP